jgi:hypothetical protein
MLFIFLFTKNQHILINILDQLKIHDAPLRKAAIEKATLEHHKEVEHLKKLNAGKLKMNLCFYFFLYY